MIPKQLILHLTKMITDQSEEHLLRKIVLSSIQTAYSVNLINGKQLK